MSILEGVTPLQSAVAELGINVVVIIIFLLLVVYIVTKIEPRLKSIELDNASTKEIIRNSNALQQECIDTIKSSHDVINNNTEAMRNFSQTMQNLTLLMQSQNENTATIKDGIKELQKDVIIVKERTKKK